VKRFLVTLSKILVPIAIITYLVYEAQKGDAFTDLRDQPKHWGMLALAWMFCTAAVLTTIVRWHFLVRALEIPTRLRNTLRIGFLGYMFNLAPLGILGGDAIKVVMLAREHQHTQAKSIASVVVDRLIGLYTLFIVASAAILVTGFWKIETPSATDHLMITQICWITFAVTVIGAIGLLLLMVPTVLDGKLVRSAEQLSRAGRPIKSLTDAARMYRDRPMVLLLAIGMSVFVHSFFAVGIYFIARGLPGDVHSLPMHFILSPLSSATGVIPFCVGPFEYVLNWLYRIVPLAGATIPPGRGFVVALGYRLITILIAAIGACYYIGARQEVVEALRDSEEDESESAPSGPTISMSEECQPAA
jgi:uncharacterized protein (TIRG00374 family)